MTYLKVDRALCTGCRTCEYACAWARTNSFDTSYSRIRLLRPSVLERKALVCAQCKKPRCVEACPRNAIVHQDGTVRVAPEACDRCGACVVACDRLFLPPSGPVVMCDQCGACLPHCPEEALSLVKSRSPGPESA